MSTPIVELYSRRIQPLPRRERIELLDLINRGLDEGRPELPEGWDELNSRRWMLIQKKTSGTLTENEATELDQLQEIVSDWLARNSVYPIDKVEAMVEKLEQEAKAGKNG